MREVTKVKSGFKTGIVKAGEVALIVELQPAGCNPETELVYDRFAQCWPEDRLFIGDPAEIDRFRLSLESPVEAGKVSLNTATVDELCSIKHVDVERAAAIVARRPWESVDDLMQITGIGPVALEDIREQNIATI